MNSDFRIWREWRAVEIQQLTIVRQRLEAVREAFRYQHTPIVIRGKLHRMPAQKGQRRSAQIDRNVEHFPPQTGDDFILGMRRILEMQPAQCPSLFRQGVIDLHDRKLNLFHRKFRRTEHPFEIATLIAMRLALNDRHPIQRGRDKVEQRAHRQPPASTNVES